MRKSELSDTSITRASSVYIYIYIYDYIYIYTHISLSLSLYVYIYIYMYTYEYLCMYICESESKDLETCSRPLLQLSATVARATLRLQASVLYTCIYIYIHIHIHNNNNNNHNISITRNPTKADRGLENTDEPSSLTQAHTPWLFSVALVWRVRPSVRSSNLVWPLRPIFSSHAWYIMRIITAYIYDTIYHSINITAHNII